MKAIADDLKMTSPIEKANAYRLRLLIYSDSSKGADSSTPVVLHYRAWLGTVWPGLAFKIKLTEISRSRKYP